MCEVQRTTAIANGLRDFLTGGRQVQEPNDIRAGQTAVTSGIEALTGNCVDPAAEAAVLLTAAVAERLGFDIGQMLRAGLEVRSRAFSGGDTAVATSRGLAAFNEGGAAVNGTGGTLAPNARTRRDDNPNAILSRIRTTGASDETAKQDGLPRRGIRGVAASHAMAETDRARVMRYKERFEEAGRRYGVPPALLAAIASRESRGGAALDRNGEGDNGHGFGLMQVDNRNPFRVVREGGPFGQQHINQAASILRDKLDQVRRQFPNLTPEQQLQTAVSRYNGGAGRPYPNSDVRTTGGDYSNDVIARAQYYAGRGDWSGGSVQSSTSTNAPRSTQYTPAPSLADVRAGRAVLKLGQQGEAVRHVQRLLNIPVDGKFGPQTDRAVKDYQRSHNLEDDGLVGRRTIASLEARGTGRTEGTERNRGAGSVDYRGNRISDPAVRAKLQEIADFLGRRVIVTSGDRDRVVNGNTRSHHLQHRAADFYVEGLSLGESYRRLKESGILARDYQVIYHTEVTTAPHLHIGRWGDNRRSDFIVDTGQILPRRR